MTNKKGQFSQGDNLLYLMSRAKDISIEDIYNYFENTNVEDVLNELYSNIKNIKGNVITDLNTLEKISKAINNDPNFYQNVQNITSNISGVSKYIITKKEDYINNTYKIADILEVKTDNVIVGTYICVDPKAYNFNNMFKQLYGVEYIENQINTLKDGVIEQLNTLEKISSAINNDPDFYQNIKTILDGKASLDDINELINDSFNSLQDELNSVSSDLNARINEITNSGGTGGSGSVTMWSFSDYSEFVDSGIKNGDYALFYDYSGVKFYNCINSAKTSFIEKFSIETNEDLIKDHISNINLYKRCLSEAEAMNLTVVDNDIIYVGEPILNSLCVCKDETSTNYNDAFLQIDDINETKRLINEAIDNMIDTELSKIYKKSETFSKEEVLQKISELVDSAPATLNTLKELSDALNNDPDFSTTILNELAIRYKKTETLSKQEILDKFSGLINSAPENLNTLKKLASALNDDPNFATTITNELSNRYKKTETLSKQEVLDKFSALINSAPEGLDTLKKLASALNNDPNFSTTILTELVKKNSVVMSGTLPAVSEREENVTYYKILT